MIISRTDKEQININLKHFSIQQRKIVLHCLSVQCYYWQRIIFFRSYQYRL